MAVFAHFFSSYARDFSKRVGPIRKTMMSVTLVTVIPTPASLMARPTRSGRGEPGRGGWGERGRWVGRWRVGWA